MLEPFGEQAESIVFSPSRDAINESVCSRLANAAAEIALTVAHTNAPALDKLGDLITAIFQHKRMLIRERPMHDLIVACRAGKPAAYQGLH